MSEADKPPVLEKPKTLVQKLAEIVAEIDNVDKRGRNEFQKYAYVKAADVAWLVRKALSSRNIYLNADVVEVRNYEIPAREGTMQAVDVKMKFTFIDGDAPGDPVITSHAYGTGTDKGDKAIYKAMTGALKYGLRHAFLIPDESDPEADSETDRATAAAKAVGEAKVAAMKGKAGKSPANASNVVPTLFYTRLANGAVELVNLEQFGKSLNEVAAEGLRLTLKKYVQNVKGDLIVPADRFEGLEQELGDCKVPFKEVPSANA